MRAGNIPSVVVVLLLISVCTQAHDPDLLGWWKCDDGTGTVAVDSSGNGNDGIFVGDPEWVAGKFGSGLLFDGQGGERVSLGNLDVHSGAISITCWFVASNLDTPGNDPRMVSKAFGGGGNDHLWMVSSSRQAGEKRLRFRLKTNDGAGTTTLVGGEGDPETRIIQLDEWIHVAATWDGATMRIYKNAVEVGSTDKGGTAVAVDPTVGAAFGNQPVGAENRPFDGTIDDVRIYTRALTADEILQVMQGPPAPLAAGPEPADGETIEQDWVNLSWQPGTWAVSHDLYVGTDFEDVNEGAEGTFAGNTTSAFHVVGFPGFPVEEGLKPGTTYYWRVDEVNEDHPDSPWKGVVWSFSLPPRTAFDPFPPDGMKFVDTNVTLSWTAKWNAALFSVYFGTDPVEVENATGAAPSGKFTFDPRTLELETTYYWRVDSFDGTEWRTGDVWSFTTTKPGGGLVGEYANYDGGGAPIPPESPFKNIALTRIDPGINFQWGNGSPEPGVIDEDNFAVRWTGELEVPLTGRYIFKATTDDGVLLWVNGAEMADSWRPQGTEEQSGTIDLVAGEFAYIKMLYFATTGNAVAELRWAHDLFPPEIIPAAALSPPIRAGLPDPANQAVNITQTPVLKWTAGGQAAQHDVYFGADAQAVANADTATADIYQGRQNQASFSPAELAWNTTYYWRVDEVNDAHPDSPWKGSVWSFTTADFLIVDDFESYNDLDPDDPQSNRIFNAWIDGFEDPTNGSLVGYANPPFAEQTIVHGGSQSMPFEYNNSAGISEATLTLTSNRDWTENGVSTLVVWYVGDPANTPEPMYVVINGNAAVTNDNPNAAQETAWTEWSIDLTRFADQGVNLTNVNSITLGFGNRANPTAGGSGTVFFDDIRLHQPGNAP
jgi:hypothetical protein